MKNSQSSPGIGRFNRRDFCKAVGVATVAGVMESTLGSVLAYADLTKEQREKLTPDEIIQQMKAGNERFRSGKPQHRDLMREAKATAKGQYPAAIIFSCVDSRAPASWFLTLVSAISSAVAWLVTLRTKTYWVAWNLLARWQVESRACHGPHRLWRYQGCH